MEPDRDREAAVAERLGVGMHGAHLVERIGWEEHDAVVDWRDRRVGRGARGPGRCDPGVVQLELTAGEASRTGVKVVDARDAAIGDDGRSGIDVRHEETVRLVYRQLALDLADREPRDAQLPPHGGQDPSQPWLEDLPDLLEARAGESARPASAIVEHTQLALRPDDSRFVELVLMGEHVIEQAPMLRRGEEVRYPHESGSLQSA